MKPLIEKEIRSSFVNCSRREAAAAALPRNFDTVDWDNLDYLGWRDPKIPGRGYLIHRTDERTHGVLLRTPGPAAGNRRVLCALCEDVHNEDDVYLFVAKRAGQAGRDFNTVGTLICADFICSRNVRAGVPPSPLIPDPDAVIRERVRGLNERTALFVRRVLSDPRET